MNTSTKLKQLLTPDPTMGHCTEIMDGQEIVRLLFVYIGSGGKISDSQSFFPGVDNAFVTALRNRTLEASTSEEAVFNHHRLVDTHVVAKSNRTVHFEVVPDGIRSVGLVHRQKEMKAITDVKANGLCFRNEDVQEVLLKGGWAFPRLRGGLLGRKCAQWAVRLYNLDRDFERLLSLIFTALDTIFGCSLGQALVRGIAWEVADCIDEGTLRGCPQHIAKKRKRKASIN